MNKKTASVEERRAYDRQWYADQNSESRSKKRALTERRRRKNKEWIHEQKRKSGCIECGERDSIVLDFHHRDSSDTVTSLAEMICRGFSIKRMQEEIEKCDVVCANCHRRHTNGV